MPSPHRLIDLILPLKSRSSLVQLLPRIGKAFLYVHLFTNYVFFANRTSGISMVPTIPHDLDGSHPYIFVSRLHRRGRNIRVGDVVTLTHPMWPQSSMAKRVIGMPGDFVSVFTPGRETDEDIAIGDGEREWSAVREQILQVPEGHCWVMGDNLDNSRDSRTYGAIPLAMVKGKVLGVAWLWGFRWFGSNSQLQDSRTEPGSIVV